MPRLVAARGKTRSCLSAHGAVARTAPRGPRGGEAGGFPAAARPGARPGRPGARASRAAARARIRSALPARCHLQVRRVANR